MLAAREYSTWIGANDLHHASADHRAGDRRRHGCMTRLRRFGAGGERPGSSTTSFGNSDRFSPPPAPAQPPPQPAQSSSRRRRPAGPRRAGARRRTDDAASTGSRPRSGSSPARSSSCSTATSSSKRSCSACRAYRRRSAPRARRAAAARRALPPQPRTPPPPPPAGRRGDAFDPSQNPNAPGAPRALGTIPPAAAQRCRQSCAQAIRIRRRRRSARPAAARPARRSICRPWPAAAARSRAAAQPGCRRPSAAGAAAAHIRAAPARRSRRCRRPTARTDNYDLAYGYILRKDYALAEDGFRNFLQPLPERPAGARRALLARRKPVPAPALPRRRRSVPERLDQVRDHRPGARCAAASRAVARGAGREGSGLRVARRKCCANIRAPRSA